MMIEYKMAMSAETHHRVALITNRQSNYQILKDVASNFVGSLSGGMFSLAMGLMLLHDTHSPLSFGLETAIVPLVGILILIPVGNLVDRCRHKTILVTSLVTRLISLVIFALLLPLFKGVSEFIPVVCYVTVNAISTNVNTTAYAASVHELVNDQKIPLLSSLTQAASALSAILAPAIGVALYALIGFETFIIVEIVATMVALVLLILMRFHYQENNNSVMSHHRGISSQLSGFKTGLVYIRQRPLIRDLILMAVVINFLFTAVTIGMPFVITNQLHAGNLPIGYIEAGFSAGIFVGSLLTSVIPNDYHFAVKILLPVILMGSGMAMLGLLFVLVTQPIQLAIIGGIILFMIGLMNAVMNISLNIRLQTTVPTHLLGRVSSTLTTSVTAIMPLGTLVYTFLFQSRFNGAVIIMVSGLTILGYVLSFLVLLLKDIRKDTAVAAK